MNFSYIGHGTLAFSGEFTATSDVWHYSPFEIGLRLSGSAVVKSSAYSYTPSLGGIFNGVADASQVVPATNSTATATCVFNLDFTNRHFSFDVTHNIASVITAVTINLGNPGVNGTEFLNLLPLATIEPGRVFGEIFLDPSSPFLSILQSAASAGGRGEVYLQIKTEDYPTSEIRAQLYGSGRSLFLTQRESSASVRRFLSYESSGSLLTLSGECIWGQNFQYEGDGSIILSGDSILAPNTAFKYIQTGTILLSDSAIQQSSHHVWETAHEGVYRGIADNIQVVAPTASTATATCAFSFRRATNGFWSGRDYVAAEITHNLTSTITSVIIGVGDIAQAGTPFFDILPLLTVDPGVLHGSLDFIDAPFIPILEIAAQISAEGRLFLQIHTEDYPTGEIRAQLHGSDGKIFPTGRESRASVRRFYTYEGSGTLTLSGTYVPRFTYEGSGTINLLGGYELNKYYTGSGTLSLSGDSITLPGLKFVSEQKRAFKTTLTGDRMIPPTGSPAVASGTITVDLDARIFSIDISHTITNTITGIGVHWPASFGNVPEVLDILSFVTVSPTTITASVPITPSFDNLVNEIQKNAGSALLYVQIKTNIFPAGEIRGHLYGNYGALFLSQETSTPDMNVTSHFIIGGDLLSLNGNSIALPTLKYISSGSLLTLSGSAITKPTLKHSATGTLSISGNPILRKRINASVSGQITLSGQALINKYSYRSSGEPFVLSGTYEDTRVYHFKYTASGGITISGIPNIVLKVHYNALGSLQISGNAINLPKLLHNPTGGFNFSGGYDDLFLLMSYFSNGGFLFRGRADVTKNFFSFTGSGTLTLGGTGKPEKLDSPIQTCEEPSDYLCLKDMSNTNCSRIRFHYPLFQKSSPKSPQNTGAFLAAITSCNQQIVPGKRTRPGPTQKLPQTVLFPGKPPVEIVSGGQPNLTKKSKTF